MYWEKTTSAFRCWFAVVSATGVIRAGLLAASFTVTVTNPVDNATSLPAVTESVVKPGLYRFDIPFAFFVANGVGEYGVCIQVTTPAPVIRAVYSDVLKISVEDFDSLPSSTADAVWDETTVGHVAVGSFGLAVQQLVGSVISAVTTAAAGSTALQIRTPMVQANDFFDNMFIVVQNVAGNVVRRISNYTNLNGAFYVDDALPFVPAPGDVVYIIAPSDSPTSIAGAVWDEPTVGHAIPGSTGEALTDIQADAVTILGLLAEIVDFQDNKLTINQATSELWLWDDAGAVVIKKWPLRDRLNANVVLGGTGPADRLTRTL